jgi:hypothetical protein
VAVIFRVSTDHAALSRKLQQSVKRYPRAAAAGINKATAGALTLSVREIQKDVSASSQKTIRQNMTMQKATAEKPEALLIARSAKTDRIPIIEMTPRPRSVTRRRPTGGVRYGRDNRLIPGSFIARMRSGHIGVFKRRDRARLPVEELHGPSVALVFSRATLLKKVTDYLREKVPQEIAKAFRFVTG